MGIQGAGWRETEQKPRDTGKGFCAAIPKFQFSLHEVFPVKSSTRPRQGPVSDAPGSSHPSQIHAGLPFPSPRAAIPRAATWDGFPRSFRLFLEKPGLGSPPNRLLELGICCRGSQIRPRERFREFLISGGQEPEPQVRARDEKWGFGTLVPINFLFRGMRLPSLPNKINLSDRLPKKAPGRHPKSPLSLFLMMGVLRHGWNCLGGKSGCWEFKRGVGNGGRTRTRDFQLPKINNAALTPRPTSTQHSLVGFIFF